MDRKEITGWLKENNPVRLERLWQLADMVRKKNVGDQVHLRGLLEISSYCVRSCAYCGLRKENSRIERYRMNEDEIMACAHQAKNSGYGTLVLQAGEDHALEAEKVAETIRRIKKELPEMAVTLSLGERNFEELALWRDSGADRYLLRFETSRRELYDRIHPGLGNRPSDRFAILRQLRELGYEVGSGVMIGIPGQSYSDLTEDVLAFGRLELDMVGSGPFIPHPNTPLGKINNGFGLAKDEQVPNNEMTAYKVIALTRIICPQANIPATTALATLNRSSGYETGLKRGANVIMPNITPSKYRLLYEIYPAKAGIDDKHECSERINRRIESVGRQTGTGRGDSSTYVAWILRNKDNERTVLCTQPRK